MAPELFTTMEANELRELAQKIAEWQAVKKLSDNALVRKLPQVGSTKTFKRILANDLAELDLEKQVASYRAAWAFLESIANDTELEDETMYDDLWAVVQLRRAFFETMRENGNARVVFLLGPTASGKSTARRALMEKYGTRLFLIEASVTWNDNPSAMLGAILNALGKREKPALQVDREEKVVELLGESRRCLIVEEAHHLGPKCLNAVKTLVNRTPGEFILVAVDTLWKKLETNAYEEARQLTGNRMAERINLGRELREKDIAKLLERRLPWANSDCAKAVRIVCDKALNYGRLAFVRDVIKRAAVKAEGKPVTVEQITDSVQEEVASR